MTHTKITEALRFAYVGVAVLSSVKARDAALTLDRLIDAIRWIPIADMPDEFNGLVEIAAGHDRYIVETSYIAGTSTGPGFRTWTCCDRTHDQTPVGTHYRPILPGPEESEVGRRG